MTKRILRGPIMADIAGPVLLEEEHALLQHPYLGGIILFARNYENPEQLCKLTESIHKVRPELLIAVDQEGGRVQRCQEGFTRLPEMQLLGKRFEKEGESALALAQNCGWLMASELLACGVDMSFAPVLDVDNDFSSIVGNRAFSDKAENIIAVAGAFIAGMKTAGMEAVGKHFPGHGAVQADSHLTTPIDKRSLDDILQRDVPPFAELIKRGMLEGIMPAHIVYAALDDKPAVFSPFWLKTILREQLGFKGVIFSDDLCMEGAAIMGDYCERARTALTAGCDMLLVCNNSAAAWEILTMLEKNQQPLTDCFASFKANKNIKNKYSLNEIQQDERCLSIEKLL